MYNCFKAEEKDEIHIQVLFRQCISSSLFALTLTVQTTSSKPEQTKLLISTTDNVSKSKEHLR